MSIRELKATRHAIIALAQIARSIGIKAICTHAAFDPGVYTDKCSGV